MTPASHHHNVKTSGQQGILWHPRDDDIICGRGPTKHPGNRMYHELVTACKNQYRELPLGHKKLLAQSIVDALHPSRFLIKQETSVKPKEDKEQEQFPYHSNKVHDDNDERTSDDASSDDEKDKIETHHHVGMSMSSDRAISQAESYDTCSTSTTCATPQKEGVYYCYVILNHEAAIRKTSQALREKGGSSGNAAAATRGGENGGIVARLNIHNELKGRQDDDRGGHQDDYTHCFAHDNFEERNVNGPATKKPRRGYGAVTTLASLAAQEQQKDGIVTFAPVDREILERQVELRFSHIQALLNKTRSRPAAESDHYGGDGIRPLF